ncbi:hypothetical protein [Fundicoccus culcitae]|uniref:Uncharacterized protein n=1 Tax=Fundicoccus culcitae TaxID=2969821 RepID=A0ABY5P7A8_9LACT|nr:hypothetical protein [Fundicoccus culcitae]UUX34370.1 hypothetical protein NRE15_01590 [Fundicoccus culcitae]
MKKKVLSSLITIMSIFSFMVTTNVEYVQANESTQIIEPMSAIYVTHQQYISSLPAPNSLYITRTQNGRRYAGTVYYTGRADLINGNFIAHYSGTLYFTGQIQSDTH